MRRWRRKVAAAALLATTTLAVGMDDAADATGPVMAECSGKWGPVIPVGASDHAPTATYVGWAAGQSGGGIIAVDGVKGNQNVWITSTHNHGSGPLAETHWRGYWTSLGGGTNSQPRVFLASGAVYPSIRVIGLDGGSWQIDAGPTGWSNWRRVSQWSATYYSTPVRALFVTADGHFAEVGSYLGQPLVRC